MTRALIDPDDVERTADVIDAAVAQAELHLAAALRSRERFPVLPPRGECLYCGADLSRYFNDALRWCPPEPGEAVEDSCVRLWERETDRRRANLD